MINYASAARGATATASSVIAANYPASAAIDAVRHTNGSSDNFTIWNSAATVSPQAPATLEINFNQSRTITEIDVFTLADAVNYTTAPTLADTFAFFGIIDFKIQYWNGAAWIDIATVAGNNRVRRRVNFTAITTAKIRLYVTSASYNVARVVEIEAWDVSPDLLLPSDGLEIYVEPQMDALGAVNGQNVAALTDYSGKSRNLSAASSYPVWQIPSANGKAGVYWDGTKNPLKNTANFTLKCGFMVVKIDEPTNFSNYAGILTDTSAFPILVGNSGTPNFYDNQQDAYLYEFRSNDRIYSRSPSTGAFAAPAPINVYKIIFFRYGIPVTVNGIQIGQDRLDTARKAKMSFAFLALYSRDFIEEEIRQYSQVIANNFALTLADVYPYQADIDNTPERSVQSINFYDPPEGSRISEALNNPKRVLDLKFSGSDQAEVETMMKFHADHYAPGLPCIYRDYRFTPPRDIEGYINSPYNLDGSMGDFTYGFSFKEK